MCCIGLLILEKEQRCLLVNASFKSWPKLITTGQSSIISEVQCWLFYLSSEQNTFIYVDVCCERMMCDKACYIYKVSFTYRLVIPDGIFWIVPKLEFEPRFFCLQRLCSEKAVLHNFTYVCLLFFIVFIFIFDLPVIK